MKTITLDESSVRAVEAALELFMRFGMGQFEYLEETLRTQSFGSEDWVKEYDTESVRALCDEMKRVAFGHSPGASYGIRNSDIPDEFRTCADVLFAIRSAKGDDRYGGMPNLSERNLKIKVEHVGDA